MSYLVPCEILSITRTWEYGDSKPSIHRVFIYRISDFIGGVTNMRRASLSSFPPNLPSMIDHQSCCATVSIGVTVKRSIFVCVLRYPICTLRWLPKVVQCLLHRRRRMERQQVDNRVRLWQQLGWKPFQPAASD